MIYVGPEVMTGHFSVDSMLFGSDMGLLGPPGVKWVMMGHESLAVQFIKPAVVTMSQITNEAIVTSQIAARVTEVFFIATGPVDLSFYSINAISFNNMKANGAEVRQWQQ